jgi:hypothetical protein
MLGAKISTICFNQVVETTNQASQVNAMQEIIRQNRTRLADSRRALGSMNAHLSQASEISKSKRKKGGK